MNTSCRQIVAAVVLGVAGGIVEATRAQQSGPAPGPPSAETPLPKRDAAGEAKVTDRLKEESGKLMELCRTPLAKSFLRAVGGLPEPKPRTVWRTKDKSKAYSQKEYDKLSAEEKRDLTRRDCTPEFFYYTGYGCPLIYSRPLEVLSEKMGADWRPARVLDFGYGSIAHLRLMVSLGMDIHGIEVELVLRALYSEAGDTGQIEGAMQRPGGRLTLHDGHWPGDAALKKAVGGGYDLIVSKNTLKLSYIHPEREVDEKYLVKLGVDDETFVRALHGALNPSGVVLIYNIAPAQNPPGQPYLAHANGHCPFPRELLEKVGFQVIAFDENDSEAIHKVWLKLGLLGKDEKAEDLPKNLFAHYTLLRKNSLSR
ncbi:MAG: hypothetical protein ACREJO_15370 [Phycisphaerales bacterium]